MALSHTPHYRPMQGSLVALVTPMDETGAVDWDCLKRLVSWHIAEGTHGIVAAGTTGEASTLDNDEHARVIETVIRTAAGRIPVIAGTGSNSTHEAIELTRIAKQLGADAALLVTPYYNKPTQEGLYRHHVAIAEAVDIPQMLYNVPGRTGVDMSNDTVIRLADVPNIVAIKDATGNLERGAELIERLAGRLSVYSGDDATAWKLILQGALGNISVTANIAPALMSKSCEAALRGDAGQASLIDTQLAELNQLLFCESNPIPAKWALHEMHQIPAGIRLPLTPLAEKLRPALIEALKRCGLLG